MAAWFPEIGAMNLPWLASLGILFFTGSALIGAQIAEDSFKSLDAEGPGAIKSDLIWRKIANVTLDSAQNLKGDGGALQADFISYGKLYVTFPSTEIPLGSALEVTLQLRYVEAPASAAHGLRLGLQNLTDIENPTNTDAQPGYLVFINPGEAAPNGTMFAVEEGVDGSMGGGKDFKSYGEAAPSIAFGKELRAIKFTVANTDAGLVSSLTYDNGETYTVTETELMAKTFNTLLIAIGNTAKASIIIEKASFALVPAAKE